MTIHEKLLKIQSELKVPKDLFNKFGNYSYRSAESILEALKPLLSKHKATLTISDEIMLIGDRYYVKAIATLRDTESDSELSSTAYAREEENRKGMDSSQLTGSTSSYARKYALNGLFAIDDTKDSDYTNKHEDKPSTKGKSLSEGQVKRLFALGYAAGFDTETIAGQVETKFNKEAKNLSKDEYDKVCEGYQGLKK